MITIATASARLVLIGAVLSLTLLPLTAWSLSDSERVILLNTDIQQDQARLAELQLELEERMTDMEDIAADRGELENALKLLEERLQQPGLSADEMNELVTQQAKLQQRVDQEISKSEIVFEWSKGIRSQIRVAEQNIEKNMLEVARLDGKEDAPEEEATVLSKPEPAGSVDQPAERKAGSTEVLEGLTPGLRTGTTPPGKAEPHSLVETAEQIQARKLAEKLATAALAATRRLDQFMERKELLEEQISLEQDQLELDKKGVVVLEDELASVATNLSAMRAAGESGARLAAEEQRMAPLESALALIVEQLGKREARLELLINRMAELDESQPAITAEAERASQEAEQAREKSLWLSSPLNPANIFRWIRIRGEGIFITLLFVGAILVLVLSFGRTLIQRIIQSTLSGRQIRGRRAETLARSFSAMLTGIVVVIGFILVLQEGGVDVSTVLGGAAIFGVAIAFGAQNLMRDYFNGIMILLEDQYGLNDLVVIGGVEGRVERMNMRTTIIRDIEGRLHFIPNGQIALVTNRSYEWGRAKFDVPVPYDCDIDRAMEILLDEANIFCADREYMTFMSDKPEMLGVNEFAESSIIIRFVIKTVADKQIPVKREMLRRIKNRFDKEGISIPFPHRVVILEK